MNETRVDLTPRQLFDKARYLRGASNPPKMKKKKRGKSEKSAIP